MPALFRRSHPAWVTLLVAASAWSCSAKSVPVQGEVDSIQVNVSAKVPGRIVELAVREGRAVKKGDLIAVLDGPEIQARVQQAEAARTAARAQSQRAARGFRVEEKRQAQQTYERARAEADLARTTYERLQRLFKDGVVPGQRRDEAETRWKTAEAAAGVSKAALDLVETGVRVEDQEAAAAQEERARAAVAEAQVYLSETRILAPIDGEVEKRNVELGELVGPGFPVVTVRDLSDQWVVLHLREDQMASLAMGDTLSGRFPALGGKDVALKVYYISPDADFATIRATSAAGGFDLKSFEVRARPVTPVEGLRPGMSAHFDWPRTSK